MPDTELSNLTTTQMKTGVSNYSVPSKSIDEAGTQDETYWVNSYWPVYLGYLKTIPEYRQAVRSLAIWACGKGWIADKRTSLILRNIRGWGEDSFDSIMQDMIVVKKTNGDSYAEIVKVDGIIANLKKLNPLRTRHVVDKKGLLVRYDIQQADGTWQKFKTNEIFHLSNDRIANEIHGTSVLESCKWVIDWKNEMLGDLRRVMHRSTIRVLYVDLDNTTKLSTIREQYKEAIRNGEVLVLPGKKGQDVEVEDLNIPPTDAWMNVINYVDNYFYEILGVSKIITGGVSGTTEANAKMGYLSFEQPYMTEQRLLEQDIFNQLGLDVTFNRPASISSTMQQSESANTGQTSFQQNDLTNKENE